MARDKASAGKCKCGVVVVKVVLLNVVMCVFGCVLDVLKGELKCRFDDDDAYSSYASTYARRVRK